MGVRMPGSTSRLFDPKVVSDLIEVEKMPIQSAQGRKDKIVKERDEFKKLQDLVGTLETSLGKLKTSTDFKRLKAESTHPDILDASIVGPTIPGNYEFEVRGMSRAQKELAYGFPDKDETPVGFGYMRIEREGQDDMEVTIEPGAKLQDVATAINAQEGGVKAMVINTKYKPDPYRLMVLSEKSGEEAKIKIDEDTTFLEFKEQVRGRNLDVLFEDVPVTDEGNELKELVGGVVFNAKKAEPGTRVNVNITHDIDGTVENIKGFITGYNAVAKFVNTEFQVDPQTQKAGILASDGTIKAVIRTLQGVLQKNSGDKGKFQSLADIGITTNPKSGELVMDDTKVKKALTDDYDSVANLFVRTEKSSGIAGGMADSIKGLKDAGNGMIKSRAKSLETLIKGQDEQITRKQAEFAHKEESIKRRFTALEGNLSGMKAQGDFLAQKFGGAAD
ncbi:MAG: flagellar filament capping protein FliD [Chitinophagaceae bacterium]|nr:flagellar filament capping protein FliD [Oligoflexus sp.]